MRERPPAIDDGMEENIAIVSARPVRSWRARKLGVYPSRIAASATRFPVPGSTGRRPVSAFDTVAGETPTSRATSVIVGRSIDLPARIFINLLAR